MSDESPVEFSIVIVTYNNEKEITPCLDAVLRASVGYSTQIIVVDNDSTDGTKARVERARGRIIGCGREIQLVQNDGNYGFTRALNQGLRASSGNFILALNPDTEISDATLIGLRNVLIEDSAIGVVAPQLAHPDGSIQPSCRRFPKRKDIIFELCGLSLLFRNHRLFNAWKMGDFDHCKSRSVDQPQGACLLFSRNVYERVGDWDVSFPMFFSDVDWCLRVKQSGFKIFFASQVRVLHHQGTSIRKRRARMILSSHISFYNYLKKHCNANNWSLATGLLGGALMVAAFVRIGVCLVTLRAFSKRHSLT